jgi:uncharacterized repeat protein (TIGR01451 family)
VPILREVVALRRPSSVTGFALPRRAIVGLLATFASIALLPCAVAAAEKVTSNFNDFSPGTIDGQHGWISGHLSTSECSGCAFDQAVVPVSHFYPGGVPGFGAQAWRLSNHIVSYAYVDQTYSTANTQPAGETQPDTVFDAQFSFITTTPDPQPNLNISVSPDVHGVGSRMSYVELIDTSGGTEVNFYDVDATGQFVFYKLALLPRGVPHTIRFWMKLNPGPSNDLVRMFIDGNDVGQCFTTWEDFYRDSTGFGPDPQELNSLQFRSSVTTPAFPTPPGAPDAVNPGVPAGGGYLFQDVTTTTSNGPGPPGCDVPIEKQADSPTVSAGGLAGYRITVRNRGRVAERNLLVCDRIPRETTFVSASRKLRRLGRRRCLFIPRLAPGQRSSFHLTLRVNGNAKPGTLDNTAEETPVEPPGEPPAAIVPPQAPGPEIPGKIAETIPPVERATSPVRVTARPTAPPPTPPPPAVTG